jgi:MSHA biogenesis protein MshJ
MNMRAKLFVIKKKLYRLKKSEIRLILITFVAILFAIKQGIFTLTGFDDLEGLDKKLNQEVSARESLLSALELAKDPKKEQKTLQIQQQLKQSALQLELVNRQLEQMNDVLVSPDRISTLLTKLLKGFSNIQLLSIAKLPIEPMLNTQGVVFMYRHKVEVVLESDYRSLAAWLQQLEQQQDRIYWYELEILSTEYPKNKITLIIYTLSEKKGWLGV